MKAITCKLCRRVRSRRFVTDGNGRIRDETPVCECVARKRRGICRYCPSRIEGGKQASLCGECRASSNARGQARWRVKREDVYRAWRKRNKKKIKAWKKRWAKKNPDKIRAQQKRYKIRHAERAALWHREYYKRNRDEIRAKDRARYPNRREEQNAYKRLYRKLSPEKHKELERRKRVYLDRQPTCVGCGRVVEWSGKGRPRKRCAGGCRELRAA